MLGGCDFEDDLCGWRSEPDGVWKLNDMPSDPIVKKFTDDNQGKGKGLYAMMSPFFIMLHYSIAILWLFRNRVHQILEL